MNGIQLRRILCHNARRMMDDETFDGLDCCRYVDVSHITVITEKRYRRRHKIPSEDYNYMSAKSISIIRKHLAHLIGMKLYELHFAGNMAMWGFSSCSSSIRFHTQSSYRMTYENQTILCMNDFYTPVRQGKTVLFSIQKEICWLFILFR